MHSPTRMNLTVTKARLKSAQTGHSLLAKKRDALTTRFRQILKKVDEVCTFWSPWGWTSHGPAMAQV